MTATWARNNTDRVMQTGRMLYEDVIEHTEKETKKLETALESEGN